MNSTKWYTLTEFVKYLGRTGQCKVEETDKGWFITLVHRDEMEVSRGWRLGGLRYSWLHVCTWQSFAVAAKPCGSFGADVPQRRLPRLLSNAFLSSHLPPNQPYNHLLPAARRRLRGRSAPSGSALSWQRRSGTRACCASR